MRLRLTGTQAECDQFVAELVAATAPGVVREVSGFYPNRGASRLGRVYLELALPPVTAVEAPSPPASPSLSATPVRGCTARRQPRSGRPR
jgi:hypothetical protein